MWHGVNDKITGIQVEEVLLFVRFANTAVRHENINIQQRNMNQMKKLEVIDKSYIEIVLTILRFQWAG